MRAPRFIINAVRRGHIVLAGVLVLFTGGAIFLISRPRHAPVPAPAPVAPPGVFENPEVVVSGPVQARSSVEVVAPVAGLLESWFVELNQEVYEGQLLGRIRSGQMDGAAHQAQLDLEKAQLRVTTLEADLISARLEVSRATADQTRARSEFDRLEKIYQRQKLLNNEGATPRLTFEKAEQDYLAAKAEFDARDVTAKQAVERVVSLTREFDEAKKAIAEKTEALENSKANLTSGDLHAPADGVIIGPRLQPGEPVDPSMKDLIQIATDLTHMQATVDPPPQAMGRVKVGLSATVRLPELTTEEFPGSVREIRGTQVIVDFTSPAPIVRPGLIAQVRIKL